MIRILIVEDEKSAAERLQKMIQRLLPDVHILAITDSVLSTVEWLKSNPTPDLMLLDIQLGDGISFNIFKQVQPNAPIIFTTAYDQYAIKAFELNSIDYLLKPIDEQKLLLSFEKYKKLKFVYKPFNISQLLESIESEKKQYKKRFVVTIADKIKMVDTKEIAYFYSTEKITYLCTFEGLQLPIDYSLDHLEALLDNTFFFRANRQYIIQDAAIEKIRLLSRSRVQLEINPEVKDGVLVSVSRTADFRRWIER